MQKIIKIIGAFGVACSSVWALADAEKLANDCISDICGPPARSNLASTQYLDVLSDYLRLVASPTPPGYSPVIEKLFADLKAENIKQGETVKAILRKSKSLGDRPLNGSAKILYNLSEWGKYSDKVKYKTEGPPDKLKVSLDEPATRTELADLSKEDQDWVIAVSNQFYAGYSQVSDTDIQSLPPSLFLKMLHPEKSADDALKVEFEKAKSALIQVGNLSPFEKAFVFGDVPYDRLNSILNNVKEGRADETEVRDLVGWNRQVQMTDRLFKGKENPLLSRPTPSAEKLIAERGGLETIIRKFDEESVRDNLEEDGHIQICKMTYYMNRRILPSKEQVDRLRGDVERAKNMMRDLVKTKFPVESQAKTLAAIDKTQFIAPPSTEDFERNFSTVVKSKVDSLQQSAGYFSSVSPEEVREIFSAVKTDDEEKKDDQTTDKNPFCDNFNYYPLADANYTALGGVILSYSTATGEESARMKIILHELGHSVSKAIAEDSAFNGLRKCLVDQHTEEMPSGSKAAFEKLKTEHPDLPGLYIEEDLADVLAGVSGKAVAGRNAFCQLLTLSEDRQKYIDLSVQARDLDPHSSGLFRVLHFEILGKGKWPDSCSKYLSTVGFKDVFTNCIEKMGTMSHQDSTTTR